MSDFVSRDEVYIAIASTSFISDPNYAAGKVLLYEEDLKNRIRDLPSARLDVNDSGLVSRRDVTNAIEETDWYHINEKGEMVLGSSSEQESWYKHDDIMEAIESIPSAESEIIRCKDCKHWFDIDDGRQRHERCADVGGDWYCADAGRRENE